MVSAIKVAGRRLHELARRASRSSVSPRKVTSSASTSDEGTEPGVLPDRGRVLVGHLRALPRGRPGAALGGGAHLRACDAGGRVASRRRAGRSMPLTAESLLPPRARLPTAAGVAGRRRARWPTSPTEGARRGPSAPRARGRGRSSTSGGELLAVYEAHGATRRSRRSCSRPGRRSVRAMEVLRDSGCCPRSDAGVRRHHRCVRRRAPRPPGGDRGGAAHARRSRGLRDRGRHVRPSSGGGRAPRVGSPAAHRPRPEARAARRDRGRLLPGDHLRRGALGGDRRGLRARGAGRLP